LPRLKKARPLINCLEAFIKDLYIMQGHLTRIQTYIKAQSIERCCSQERPHYPATEAGAEPVQYLMRFGETIPYESFAVLH
jgi:hypothetical protein